MRTAVAALALLLVAVLTGGFVVASGWFAPSPTADDAAQGTLEPRWEVSELQTSSHGNHHQPAVLRRGDGALVLVPLNGQDEDCRLVALRADGSETWRHEVPPDECDPHAVGDVATGSFPGEEPSVLVTTGERKVLALAPADGDVRFEHELDAFGYSSPVVVNDGRRTLVATDFYGSVTAVAANGSERWTHELGSLVWARPMVATTPDGDRRIVLAGGQPGDSGVLRGLDADGAEQWTAEFDRPVRSADRTTIDGEPAVVAASVDGSVTAVRAEDGATLWSRSFGSTPRVRTGGHGLYVVDDGTARRLALGNGSTVWTRSIDGEFDVAMRAEVASLGGDRTAVVVLDQRGGLNLLAADSGERLASHRVDAELLAPPAAADVTGDGVDELVVVYGDGRIALLAYDPPSDGQEQ